MANYVLTRDQLAKLEIYNKYGWPPILYKDDLIIYFRRQWATIQKYYLSRPDSPIQKIAGQWSVPYEDLKGFISAVYTGQIYKGLSLAEFSNPEDL